MVATASLAGGRQVAGQTDGGAEQLGGTLPLERRLALDEYLQRGQQRGFWVKDGRTVASEELIPLN